MLQEAGDDDNSLIKRSWCGDGALPAVPWDEEIDDDMMIRFLPF
jgi:hypothetical protein